MIRLGRRRGVFFAGTMMIVVVAIAIWMAASLWPGMEDPPIGVGQSTGERSVRYSEFDERLPSSVPSREPLWQPIKESSVTKLPAYASEWSVEGRALVSIAGASDAARNWRVGDRLAIPVPQLGETFFPLIEEIDEGPGHVRSAVGRIALPGGRSGRVVVTVGPQGLFAWLDTTDGPYELLADAEIGWLLPRSSIVAGIDFSQPDYQLPEHLGKRR
ncbi:MAG: hypothetical protein F4149_05100 [Gammaproteobacteria bacterium]|nr:hypothetical protein [Gammaproteobacteria bacterium]MYK82826.1 hypothetical protein [Gammaproteobacteria bacterium]